MRIKSAGVAAVPGEEDLTWGAIAGDIRGGGRAGGGIIGSDNGSGDTESWPDPSLLLSWSERMS